MFQHALVYNMFTLGQLLIFSLAVPSYARPVDAPSSDETIPILLLPPSVGKHPTPPFRPSVVPLFHSDSDPGSVPSPGLAEQGSTSTLIDVKPTTLTVKVAPTQTIHIAQTRVITVTITVQATPTSTADEGKETAKPNAEPGPDTPIMATYFPDWTGEEFPPEKVDFSRFAWIDFAFAVPDENQQLTFTSDNSEDLLHRLVRAAHAHGSKVKLSVGGWTGSRHFSDAVSNNANRHQFVKNIVSAYEKFNIDGIDLDWEYPGVQGASENKVTPADSAHFLLFLQLLRTNLPDAAKITAATQVTPFAGPDGRPMNDVSAFAKVFDWILIMNYDIWGASPTPGPNAPLRDGCHNSTQPDASASSSIAAWTNAGFAPKQLTLGLPSYGYVQTSSAQRLIQRRHNAFQRGAGARFAKLRVRQEEDDEDDSMDATAVGGSVRIKGEGTGDDSGQVQFKQLVKEGALKLSSSGSYVGSGGFNRMWDVCSSTPYLVSKNTKQLVAYDDPQSLGMKAAYARGAGILGVNMFDVHGDTEDWTLTDAIREGLGL